MSYKYFEIKNDDGVGVVTLNKPPANALNAELMDEMDQIISEMEKDQAVRCVLFRSSIERFFCAGFDLMDFPPALMEKYVRPDKTFDEAGFTSAIEERTRVALKHVQKVFRMIEMMSKPTVAAINGFALGGGLELALSCDFRFMGNGKVGLTEVNLGAIPLGGGTQRLPRLIGKSKAMALLFDGPKLSADEALALGIVDKVFPADKLDEESLNYAKKLAAGPTRAMSIMKRIVSEGLEMELSKGLQLESDAYDEVRITQDAAEGRKAFIEKRKPKFTGK